MHESNDEKAMRQALRLVRAARAKEAEYPVGYSKPPENTRFSGDKQPPRTKKPKPPPMTPLERFEKIAREKVEVMMNGKKVRMEQAELIDRAAIQDAKKNARARADFHKRMDLAAKWVVVHEKEAVDNYEFVKAKIEAMASRREAREEAERKLAEGKVPTTNVK
jgi:hypothetical protein